MPDLHRRLPGNVPGDFYVDETCIDCATCRWVAPESFSAYQGKSRVGIQPVTDAQIHRARMAILACPTASIGTVTRHDMLPARMSFPDQVEDEVYHCGYHSKSSYGAASWLILHPQGNILVDSPRFTSPLVKQLEKMGGVRHMFLTHRDDVADHQKFRDHFRCDRWLHRADVSSETSGVERIFEGEAPVTLAREASLLPMPGHTAGSTVLLYRDTFLFSGDHAAWSISRGQIFAFEDVCWYSFSEQKRSMERLGRYRFRWLLPGHGRPCHLPQARMKQEIQACAARM